VKGGHLVAAIPAENGIFFNWCITIRTLHGSFPSRPFVRYIVGTKDCNQINN
jgi:hypothetical protein